MSACEYAANGQPLLDSKAAGDLLGCAMAQVHRLPIPYQSIGKKRFYQADEIEKFQQTQMKENQT